MGGSVSTNARIDGLGEKFWADYQSFIGAVANGSFPRGKTFADFLGQPLTGAFMGMETGAEDQAKKLERDLKQDSKHLPVDIKRPEAPDWR